MMDEAGIKFRCDWNKKTPLSDSELKEIDLWRDRLYQFDLIGVYENGVGFGNLSVRFGGTKQFLITGSQTSVLPKLRPEHYTLVTDYRVGDNWVRCEGPIQASSESLTHAVIYEMSPEIQAVVHGHHKELWQRLLHKLPTASEKISCGTPQMALEMKRLYQETNLRDVKILVMGGHKEGMISFGGSLPEACNALLNFFKPLL